MPVLQFRFEAVDATAPSIQALANNFMEAARNSDRLATEITNNSRRIDTSLKKIAPPAKEASESISKLESASKRLEQNLLGFVSVAAVGAFFKSAADAALQEEEALRRLAFAVDATGGSFAQSKEAILAFAQQQQATTQFSDTQTFEAMGRLVRVTGDVGQAMQATRLAFGLASASGKDFNSVLDLLSPVLQGDASRLRALKNEFGAFIGDANTAQEVVDALSGRFLGAAEKQQGFAAEIQKSKNALGDFQEKVGAGVLPAITLLLKGGEFVAKVFEELATVLAGSVAIIVEQFKFLGGAIKDVFTGNFGSIGARFNDLQVRTKSVVESTAEEINDIEARFSKDRIKLALDEEKVKVGTTTKSIEDAVREANEKKKAAQDAHDFVVRLEAERLDLSGQDLESKLELIELEKEQRLRQIEDLKARGVLSEEEITAARVNASEIAKLKSKETAESLDEDFKALEAGAKQVEAAFASSISGALADVIVEGKNMKEAFDAAFKSILKTAIETFTRIAIESAILRGSTSGLGVLGGFLAVGGFASGAFKGIKLQEGGIVRRPTFATVGEAGPEAVIPLERLGKFGGDVNVSVTQNNTVNIQSSNEEQVRLLMRRIAEATRSGAAEGAELVKSILSKQALTRQSV